MTDHGDWRDIMRADVASLPSSRRPREEDLISSTTDFRHASYSAVVAAAKLRGVTLGAFIRRAAYAMAAHDLGIGLHELTTRDERMANTKGFSLPDPDGTRFGAWEIQSLRGEDVDS